jgi:hypothetical protein
VRLEKAYARWKKEVARLRRANRKPPLRLRAFNHAKAHLHVREQGGNNRGVDVERIIRMNQGVPGEPWCGDFVAAMYLLAGSKSVVRSWAAVRYLEKLLTATSRPRRGHVVIYDFDHTGMFDGWISGGYFWAIEGNTGSGGAVSDSAGGGDGVHRRKRHLSQVSSFRRVLR